MALSGTVDRKPKFRSRKLEVGKAIQFYRWDAQEALDDFESPMRAVQPMATGVDREEEDEHHLQAALSARAAGVSHHKEQAKAVAAYMIPTPETMRRIDDYDVVYPPDAWRMPKALVKGGQTIEDVYQTQAAHYCALPADRQLCEELGVAVEIFEWIIDCFEDTARQLSEAAVGPEAIERLRCLDKLVPMLPNPEQLERILAHWRLQRQQHAGAPLIPLLRLHDAGKLGADPYVCFRRRELKLPRKTRRADAQVHDKLRRMHYDLANQLVAIQAALKRDRWKREALLSEQTVFEKYWALEQWRRSQPPGTTLGDDLPSFKQAMFSHHHPSRPEPEQASMASSPSPSKRSKTGGANSKRKRRPTVGSMASAPPVNYRYSRPYYSLELAKQMQVEMAALLGDGTREDGLEEDWVNTEDESFEASEEWLQIDAPELGDPATCMRLHPRIVDRRPFCPAPPLLQPSLLSSTMLQPPPHHPTLLPEPGNPRSAINSAARLRILGLRDLTHLQPTAIPNYNQHYLLTTADIKRPLSWAAWIAACQPILQTAQGGRKSGQGSPSKRPRKSDLPETTSAPSSSQPPVASQPVLPTQNQTPAMPTRNHPSSGEIAKLSPLSSTQQITVKVKSNASNANPAGVVTSSVTIGPPPS